MQRTLGFDFGTHQTKICIEEKDGAVTNYHFFPFSDLDGVSHFMLPSLIGINADGRLQYGFTDGTEQDRIRYFKQASFCTDDFKWTNTVPADYYSIWYIAFILFHIEARYATDFATQMGAPTDTAHLDTNKRRAVMLMLSAIYLVEDVFQNDLDAFLATPIDQLFKKTKLVTYSKQLKEEYSILVFPEAYACLHPILAGRRITSGMSLILDVGGGTTDISFYTLNGDRPRIHQFISIPKGLNYLTGIDGDDSENANDSKVQSDEEIIRKRIKSFEQTLNTKLNELKDRVREIFVSSTRFDEQRVLDALEGRPIVYAGGGSSFKILCRPYAGFTEVRQVSAADWNISCFPGFEEQQLVPILNTAFGLSISEKDDDIEIAPLEELFDSISKGGYNAPQEISSNAQIVNKNYILEEKVEFIDCKRKMPEVKIPDLAAITRPSAVSANKVGGKKKSTGKPKVVVVLMKAYDREILQNVLNYHYTALFKISPRLMNSYLLNVEEPDLKKWFKAECKIWNKECEALENRRKREKDIYLSLLKKKNKPQEPVKKRRKRFHNSKEQLDQKIEQLRHS